MKKVITLSISIMALFLLAACGKNTTKNTTQHEEVQTVKLNVDTKTKKTNALGNVLIKIKTDADADVSIYNAKTKKTKVITADAGGKVIYNGHLDKKTKSVEFKISAATGDGTTSKTVKLTIKNASDAYKKWKEDQEEETDVTEDEMSSSESSSSEDVTTDSGDTTGYDDSNNTNGNYYGGNGNTGGSGTSSVTGGGSSTSNTTGGSSVTGGGNSATTTGTADTEPVAQSATLEE